MSSEIPKAYDPKNVEDRIYKLWEESGFFSPEGLSAVSSAKEDRFISRKFAATIAPPNITGELHMGHALEHTLQDIIFRFKRMQGFKTLWVPGIDHAGIAAQNVVEKQLAKEGTSRHELGREKFLERMWEWKENNGNIILNQFKKLGLSVDWTRTRFTMDEPYRKAVETAFIHYYKKGWIYRGERVVNWCIRCSTSVSDLEVNYIPENGKLYYIKYGPFTLATVRPETKLGDTGLAVHPDDRRYKKYAGQELDIESADNSVPADKPAKSKTIKIRVVADEAVDPDFGTGIIKVTPAHDITDFEIGQKHNLPSLKVIDERGKMNENAGVRYQGLKTSEARGKIVKDLEDIGLMEKVEDYEHNVARCDRCNSVIEPLPSLQWFLKTKELAKMALKAIDPELSPAASHGAGKNKVAIKPERWVGPYKSWLENIRDWNISRQIWWGHKIPIEGEEDVLDTWFSSALWPFAALGWPIACAQIKNERLKMKDYCEPLRGSDLSEYYPTDLITSDRGILFLWIVRMIFSGIEFTGKAPFREIYIHPTVLTKDGKRMSKSLGTGVNPLELINKYGADALRFGLASQVTGLQDIKFGEDLMIMGRKFANKVWNISRYILMRTGDDYDWETPKSSKGLDEIAINLEGLFDHVAKNIESYNFAEAANAIYKFLWHEVADKYLEESKSRNDQKTKDTLAFVLVNMLKLLHPFMPFVTEEIYGKLPIKDKKLLMVENWSA